MWNFKDILLSVILSFVIITGLNYIAHSVFNIPIVKSGVLILFFMVGVILSSLVIFIRDGSFDAQDVKGLLVVTAVVIGLYFGIRFTLPELFSILPSYTKEVFSIFG